MARKFMRFLKAYQVYHCCVNSGSKAPLYSALLQSNRTLRDQFHSSDDVSGIPGSL